jgi:peroxiredoxin
MVRFWSPLVVGLAAVLSSPAAFAADSAAAPAPAAAAALTGPQVGAPAPAFSLKTIDGKIVSLDSFKGKTLVINAWATWCPPCRHEMPDFIAAAPKLAKNGVVMLGVDSTEDAPIVRAFVAAKSVPYAQAIDADKTFSTAYDIAYFPTTYVIDPQGILRARYVDVLAPAELAALVAAAQAGRSADIVSPLQAKIDATLTDPAITFDGDASAVAANAKKADAAIAAAEKLLDDSDSAKGNATDLLRTRTEEAALRDRTIAALVSVGTSVDDKTLLPRLRGDAARDRENWKDALDAYRAVIALDPKNEDALSGIALAAGRLDQRDAVIDADTQLAMLEPADVETLVDLARAQAKNDKTADAYATFLKAITVARAAVDANPANAHAIRMLAWAHLYFGRTYAEHGDPAHARAEFDEMLVWSAKLPAADDRHDMYLEEGQEALVALGLAAPANGASVSLAPWTGADLPGSIPNTFKYRLVVAGPSGRTVALTASGVPKGWVASFCTDKVCAPFRTSVALPDSGVKIVEFQLIPPQAKASAPKVRVTGNDGGRQSSATT